MGKRAWNRHFFRHGKYGNTEDTISDDSIYRLGNICKVDVAEAFLTTTVNKGHPPHISHHKHVDMSYYTRRPPGLTDEDMPYIMKPTCYINGHPLAMTFFSMDAKQMFVNGLEFSSSNCDQRVYYKRDERGTILVAHAVDEHRHLNLRIGLSVISER